MRSANARIAAALTAACATAGGADLPPAMGIGDLLNAAWRDGVASGRVVAGPLPAMFRDFHRANGPLVVTARRGAAFPEPGCARYELSFTQMGADPGGAPPPASVTVSLNHCLDGSAPGSALDLDLLGDLVRRHGRR